MIRWCTITEIWCDRCNCYFSFWAIFCTFTHLKAQKIKISEKKDMPRNIIILQMCTKNYDQMMYGSWDTVRDRRNCHFSFWVIFCPFIPLTAWKIKILKKWKKLLEISSFCIYNCTKNFDQMSMVPEICCAMDGNIWIATENLQLPNLYPMKFNLSVKGTWGWSYTWFKVLLTLGLFGKSGPQYCTLNHQEGYIDCLN